MKKLLILKLILISLFILPASSFAFTMDVNGYLGEWGVTPASDWTPNAGIWYTEENQTSNFLNPGYGGQNFDVEAMYTTYDVNNLYFAVVTGFPSGGRDGYKAGDIAISFGNDPNDNTYEYGVSATNHGSFVKGALYSASSWNPGLSNWGYGNVGPLGAPTAMTSGSYIGKPAGTNLVYASRYSRYVIEGYVPKSLFRGAWQNEFKLHWSMTCGNDAIDLQTTTPEPASLTLLGLGLLGLFRFRRKA